MIDGLILVLVGGYFWLAALGKVPLHTDPVESAELRLRLGPWGKLLGPVAVAAGLVLVARDLWIR